MAFNAQVFKTRALTAIIFAAVMLAGLLINHWTFLLLFTVIHFGCWFEYQKLVGFIDPGYKTISPFHKYGVMIGGYGFMLWMLNGAYKIAGISLHEVGWALVLIVAIAHPITEVLFGKKGGMKNTAHSFFGLVYISLSWGLMMDITFMGAEKASTVEHTWRDLFMYIPLFVIGCMWVNDTMAYIVGSFIGKTPFSKISPKKTWEGTIGGVILSSVLMGYLMGVWDKWFIYGKSFFFWIVLAAIAAIIGTMGDLLESKLKRLANVKDSGSLMPGHGGFLDRFDSLLLAVPFVWLYLKLFL
jgi:phosphatidate cytidylyltransferase